MIRFSDNAVFSLICCLMKLSTAVVNLPETSLVGVSAELYTYYYVSCMLSYAMRHRGERSGGPPGLLNRLRFRYVFICMEGQCTTNVCGVVHWPCFPCKRSNFRSNGNTVIQPENNGERGPEFWSRIHSKEDLQLMLDLDFTPGL
jgi:hypothetical protein